MGGLVEEVAAAWVVVAWRGKNPIGRLRTYGVRDHALAVGYVERLSEKGAAGIGYSIEDVNNVPETVPVMEAGNVAVR